jgi:two-component system, sensor histidine kinase LadS
MMSPYFLFALLRVAFARFCTYLLDSSAPILCALVLLQPCISLAIQQIPQPVTGPAAQATPQLSTIVLGNQDKHREIDALSEYWVDESGEATIEQVIAGQAGATIFSPRQHAQRHAIHGKALWLRFSTQITDVRAAWFLEVSLSTADDVTLYWRDGYGQWVKLNAGDMVPHAKWPVLDRFPLFKLSQDTAGPTEYYMRVEHQRISFSAPLHIYRDTELIAQRQIEHFFLGGYFGLLLLVGLVCVSLSIVMRDKTFLQYLVYISAIGASQATFTGLAGQYLWPNATEWANSANFFLPGLGLVVGMWFVRTVTKPRVYLPRVDQLALLLIAIQSINCVMELVYPTLWGFYVLTFTSLGLALIVYTIAWFGWTRGDVGVRWIAMGFLPVVLGLTPVILRNMGLLGTNFLTQYGVTLGSAIEMPLLLYGLVLRASTRSESRARTAGLPTRDALTGLSNMRELLSQIHGAMTRAKRYQQPYGLILVEMQNYHWFNKEHGREISDRALVLLGTRLQLVARDVDTAGRIDETHFVLLIEGPCKPSYAAKVAARIAASAHRPTELLPVGSSIKLRITCAIMPDPQALELGDDANAQLGWLVACSESLPDEPRKSIRTLNF